MTDETLIILHRELHFSPL